MNTRNKLTVYKFRKIIEKALNCANNYFQLKRTDVPIIEILSSTRNKIVSEIDWTKC